MRKKLITFAVLTALFISLTITLRAYHAMKADRDRLRQNQSYLLHNGSAEIDKTATGNSMASAPAVTLKSSEFRQSADTLTSIAKSMRIRPSRITQAATTAAEMRADITAPIIPDSSDKPPSPSMRVVNRSSLHYEDPWLTLSGTITSDTTTEIIGRSFFSGTIRSRDTLDIIVHRVPKRFLFFRFGCKAVRMNISSRNRHTVLTYARYYQIHN